MPPVPLPEGDDTLPKESILSVVGWFGVAGRRRPLRPFCPVVSLVVTRYDDDCDRCSALALALADREDSEGRRRRRPVAAVGLEAR